MVAFFLCTISAFAQQQKEVKTQFQTWISENSTMRFSDHWGMIADFHVRRNNFVNEPGFYFIRFGANYWMKNNFTTAFGYGHTWLAQKGKDGGYIYSNENRVYQQLQYISKIGNLSMLQRLRNEQRWQQKVMGGEVTNDLRFTDRVRYLLSINFPVFRNPKLPQLLIVDELLIQFGKDIVYNIFDQNRFTLGIKQNLSKAWRFDLGYMLVYQEKYSGYQYDLNHTIRWFFYYTPDFRRRNSLPPNAVHNSGDE